MIKGDNISRTHLKISAFLICCLAALIIITSPVTAQDEEMDDYGPSFFTCIFVFFAIALVVAILIAIWIYQDANSRGMSGGLWAALFIIATVFGGFIGFFIILVIYFVVRMNHPVGGWYYPPYPGYPPPPPGYYPPPGYPPPGYYPPPPGYYQPPPR